MSSVHIIIISSLAGLSICLCMTLAICFPFLRKGIRQFIIERKSRNNDILRGAIQDDDIVIDINNNIEDEFKSSFIQEKPELVFHNDDNNKSNVSAEDDDTITV